jgi:hypothetical protein
MISDLIDRIIAVYHDARSLVTHMSALYRWTLHGATLLELATSLAIASPVRTD